MLLYGGSGRGRLAPAQQIWFTQIGQTILLALKVVVYDTDLYDTDENRRHSDLSEMLYEASTPCNSGSRVQLILIFWDLLCPHLAPGLH
jgi:hypothetical protein